jgi:esterase/lipase
MLDSPLHVNHRLGEKVVPSLIVSKPIVVLTVEEAIIITASTIGLIETIVSSTRKLKVHVSSSHVLTQSQKCGVKKFHFD